MFFCSIFAPTWLHLGSQNGTKMPPKTEQKKEQKTRCKRYLSESNLWPSESQKSLKNLRKSNKKQKMKKSILDAILAPKCSLLGTLLASKTVKKLCCKNIYFLFRFGWHFGAILAPQMEPSWSKNRTKKIIKKNDDLQERPRWAKGWFWEGLGVALGRSGAAPGAFWRHFGSKKRIFSEFSRLKTWFCSELCILAKDFLKSCCLLMLL